MELGADGGVAVAQEGQLPRAARSGAERVRTRCARWRAGVRTRWPRGRGTCWGPTETRKTRRKRLRRHTSAKAAGTRALKRRAGILFFFYLELQCPERLRHGSSLRARVAAHAVSACECEECTCFAM